MIQKGALSKILTLHRIINEPDSNRITDLWEFEKQGHKLWVERIVKGNSLLTVLLNLT